eukprot:889723-Amphidinium_carterae.1
MTMTMMLMMTTTMRQQQRGDVLLWSLWSFPSRLMFRHMIEIILDRRIRLASVNKIAAGMYHLQHQHDCTQSRGLKHAFCNGKLDKVVSTTL